MHSVKDTGFKRFMTYGVTIKVAEHRKETT